MDRQQQIIDYLAIAPQPKESNSDALDDLREVLEGLYESGDLVALMGVVAQANAMAQKLIAEQAKAARRASQVQ